MNQGRFVGRALLAPLTTVAALMAIPPGAGATTTIGSNLAGSPTYDAWCMPRACTEGHWVLPQTSQAPGGVFAPNDGVVVRWRVKIGIETLPSALGITGPGSSASRVDAGHGPFVTPPTDQISTYDVRLPIQAGDALGLACCTSLEHGQYVKAITPGAVNLLWSPPFELGSGQPGFAQPDQELLVNADIESDCDGDGLGDESQDASTSPCPTCKGQPATIVGTSGDDVRTGTPGRDVMVGLAGNDKLSGLEGDDTICGGAGNDTLYGGPGQRHPARPEGQGQALRRGEQGHPEGRFRQGQAQGGRGQGPLRGRQGPGHRLQVRGREVDLRARLRPRSRRLAGIGDCRCGRKAWGSDGHAQRGSARGAGPE